MTYISSIDENLVQDGGDQMSNYGSTETGTFKRFFLIFLTQYLYHY